jgi:hypothetical protein
MARPPATLLHGSEFIRLRLADWYVEQGLVPPGALDKVAEITFELMRQGPVNVWRHVDDGTLRPRLQRNGSRDGNEERVATFRPARKRGR